MNQNSVISTLVSVAIITRNSRNELERLLESLKEPLKNSGHEICLVDNGSSDGSVETIRSKYPDVKLIVNKANNGVAPARNQALRLCSGKYIFILDADCEYRDGNLNKATKYLDDNPDVAILGFRVYYPNGKLQDTARTLPSPKDLLVNRMDSSRKIRNSPTFVRHRMREFDPMKLREAGFVAGACQFFKRDLLDQIGFLDEKMFYGYEDSDFCARIIKAGKKVVYFPDIVVIHHHQRLTKKNPFSRMTLIQMRSYKIFYAKHRDIIEKANEKLLNSNSPPPIN